MISRDCPASRLNFPLDRYLKLIFICEDLPVGILNIMHFFHQNETLIAIRAPHGTTLEVPDPDEVI